MMSVSIPVLYGKALNEILYPGSPPIMLDKSRATLIFHTMDGYLLGTEQAFKSNGPNGIRSHFGIGGPSDGANYPEYDGQVRQWTELNRVAYAQWSGNGFGISVETSDGHISSPTPPWSDAQLQSIITLCVDFAKWCGVKTLAVCDTPDGKLGTIGWHSLFPMWNQSHHDCPGAARISQLNNEVLPAANHILMGGEMSAYDDVVRALRDTLRLPASGLQVPFGQSDNGQFAAITVGGEQQSYNREQTMLAMLRTMSQQLTAMNTTLIDIASSLSKPDTPTTH